MIKEGKQQQVHLQTVKDLKRLWSKRSGIKNSLTVEGDLHTCQGRRHANVTGFIVGFEIHENGHR